MEEIWKPILGYEGKYEISSRGVVKTVKTGRLNSSHYLDRQGYPRASLFINGKVTVFSIHRLVAINFLGLPVPPKNQVNHINHIKTDNRVENLEWTTAVENIRHSLHLRPKTHRPHKEKFSCAYPRVKPAYQARGSLSMKTILTDEKVLELRHLASSGMKQKDVARKFGISEGSVSQIVHRRTWTHI